MLTRRRRLRDEDILIDRDLDFLIKLRQGRRKRDVAFAYRITIHHLNERLRDIPPELKEAVCRMVDRYTAEDFPFVPDAALDSFRNVMRERVRVERNLGKLQTA